MSIARRIAALEAEDRRHALALPPREWLRRGWLAPLFAQLAPPEREELTAILEQSFTDTGAIDYRRITPAQRERATALLARIGAQLP